MSIPVYEKLIQRQIHSWNSLRRYLDDTRNAGPTPTAPVITVSRQAGSGGRTLARTLATRLDLEYQGKSLVSRIAQDTQLEDSLIEQLDETAVNQANLWVSGVLNRRIFLKDQYHKALARVVTALAARGGVVFLGRGANLILGENATLRIRVTAPIGQRTKRIQERLRISRAEARAVLEEIDRNRAEFIRQVFRAEPGQPENFDLTINAERFSTETMVEIALLTLLSRQAATLTPEKEESARA